MGEQRGPAAAGARPPLAYPAFDRALLGNILRTGSAWVEGVGYGWLIYHLGHSAFAVAVFSAARTIPFALLSEAGGLLGRRWGPRRVGAVCLVGIALGTAGLAGLIVSGHLGLPALFCLAVPLAGLTALARPNAQEVIPNAVPVSVRAQALAIEGLGNNAASIAGPLVGAWLLDAYGAAACFAVRSAACLCFAAVLLSSPSPTRHGASAGRAPAPRDRRSSLRLFLASSTAAIVLEVFALHALAGPIAALVPALVHRYPQGGHLLGVAYAAAALGGAVANGLLLILRRKHVRGSPQLLIAGTMAVAGASVAGIAFADRPGSRWSCWPRWASPSPASIPWPWPACS